MNVKLFLKNNMPWYAAYNFNNSSKHDPEKNLICSFKKTRKA